MFAIIQGDVKQVQMQTAFTTSMSDRARSFFNERVKMFMKEISAYTFLRGVDCILFNLYEFMLQ